jgi:elongation factor Ts
MSATITASLVKELRDRTSLGMMECKKALEETNGDMDAAIRVLRERGALKAAKRADRVANEGLIEFAGNADHSAGALAYITCETDFVARNDDFAALTREIATLGLAKGAATREAAEALVLADGRTAATAVADTQTRIGEKIQLGRYEYVAGDVVAGYIHPPGKIGVLVAASAEGVAADKKAAVVETLRDVAMHVAAFAPRFLDDSQVNADVLNAEREIYAAQARNEGKPENIIERIVDGKIKSFYKDNCLVHQPFAKDPGKTITQLLAETGKAVGGKVTLTKFVRVQVGEGAEA